MPPSPIHPPAVALDAMGGDHAPSAEVEGAVLAASELGLPVLLVGPEKRLRQELAACGRDNLPIEIVDATQIITMQDRAASAVRRKRDSSIRVALRLVREGRAQCAVSAGNTGAVMAAAKISWGALPHVDRPALAAVLPGAGGRRTLMIDAGANVDCTARQLHQFAVMGSTYARLLLNIPQPRVGLLSIGAEPSKGNDLTRQAYRLLENSSLNFVGNVEGRDIYNGRVDVVVCDGFTGNVALKISEGLADTIQGLLRESFRDLLAESPAGRVAGALADFARKVDYSETGGAPLLGVRGVCTICHGSSSGRAIRNAIRVAAELVSAGVNEKIESELEAAIGDAAPRVTGAAATGELQKQSAATRRRA